MLKLKNLPANQVICVFDQVRKPELRNASVELSDAYAKSNSESRNQQALIENQVAGI